MSGRGIMNGGASAGGREAGLRAAGIAGAILGYGGLAAFLCLVGMQLYAWFRDDEWTHFGVSEGLRVGLARLGVRDGDAGRLPSLLHWLNTPADWLGLHRVLEVVPASLVLFALSILGNSIYIYCTDRGRGAGP